MRRPRLGLAPLAALAVTLAVAFAVLLTGCATTALEGDLHFRNGDCAEAERAYREYLTSGRSKGDEKSRARYHLGLIYALPECDRYDWERAETAFESVIQDDPASLWAQQAALVMNLTSERARLTAELEGQRSRVDFMLGEVRKLQVETRAAEDEVGEREVKLEELTGEIQEMERRLAGLQEELEARENELDRIKKIDLETPP